MAKREFMSLGFYALLRVLYSLWTSIIRTHLYNCLRKETPRTAQEELPKVLWRHFSHDRRGESPSTPHSAHSGHALGWCCLDFLCVSWIFSEFHLDFHVFHALLQPQTSAGMKNTACEKPVVLLHLSAMMYWWYYSPIP